MKSQFQPDFTNNFITKVMIIFGVKIEPEYLEKVKTLDTQQTAI
jgi:hypothetical protein